ncbi:ABC transporter substrate-binding protein [Inmirania thermothiophila]|uniref:Extracellular solute-binding protein (Family 5) n=1 Tax=Inmirania thermothiophila TaxID=1750597 RepID=A0A3N1Y0F8_9GAMM|nr:ABC transporter substrate-binding protein [Inmirania thermothiophila]ROR32001.1 extracellular solute-binding protein (family 5) [Inmirania thermothiophila]
MAAALLAAGCSDRPWNSPYPVEEAGRPILYASFQERPKHLDPARAYSANEYAFIAQIYEPPLHYHYLKRPYTLEPLAAAAMPREILLDGAGRVLPPDAPPEAVAFTVYEIRIRRGMRYQPHPALARDDAGRLLYARAPPELLRRVRRLADFPRSGTREVTAADFVHQIKRLAHPALHSPILGLMAEHIVGLAELAARLRADWEAGGRGFLDLGRYRLEGAEVVDRYTYRIRIRGRYPQMIYWLAMPFFAPVPPEADRFYAQPGLAERNITMDWYPIGSGPFMLVENNPNRRMVLARNPNFHGEAYPVEGAPGDEARGLLRDAGQALPLVERAVYSLEKEDIPYWNKFLQGWYDVSGISSDSFDQAVRIGGRGEAEVSPALAAQGIRLLTDVAPSIFYLGFNMLDPVVGGGSASARLLRRALSIAIDYDEYIAIFLNGRGIAAQGPIPPGIFGHRPGAAGVNPYVYRWVDGRPVRRGLDEARALLAQAGYPDGRDPRTGRPLVLHLDVTATGPEDKARLDWFRKQFAKLGIQLVIRATDYNRFQDKMARGDAQIFLWGWNADYPDPENFLFLLYGANGKAAHGGENAANYADSEFDRLFERMRAMPDGPARQAVIDRMVEIVRRDAPWVWGLHPKRFLLHHAWYGNASLNAMANDTLKYVRIDPALRERLRGAWNRPVLWPLGVALGLLAAAVLPAWAAYRRRERRTAFGEGGA